MNRYDHLLEPTQLERPRDDANQNRDRTAGAVGEIQQIPQPIAISGSVYEDRNATLNQDGDDPGIRLPPDTRVGLTLLSPFYQPKAVL